VTLARRSALPVLLAAAVGSSGCSFFAVRPPEKVVADPSKPLVTCSTAPLPAAVDVVWATAYGILYAKALADGATEPAFKVMGGLMLGTLAASASYGFWAGSRCGDLKELNTRCMRGDRAACLALNPGYVPGRPGGVPLLCARDADCAAGQACVQSACVEPAAPAPPPPPRRPE
jgi:hypothetical protein